MPAEAAPARHLRSALYVGKTVHTRLKPSFNHFVYSLFMAYVDLAELERGALERWPLFSSRTPWALTSLLAGDHLCGGESPQSPAPLSERLRDAVQARTGRRPGGPVCLLAGLRILGLEFNPVSFFYVLEVDGEVVDTMKAPKVEQFVAEVNNIPWFEQHLYILSPKASTKPVDVRARDRGIRSHPVELDSDRLEVVQECPSSSEPGGSLGTAANEPMAVDSSLQLRFNPFEGHAKAFHVSPFMPIADITYEWLVTDPGERIGVRIGLAEDDVRFFSASIDMRRRRFSTLALLRLLLTFPLMAVKVVLAIMFEAAKLWFRGFTFFPHPTGKETASSRAIAVVVAWAVGIQGRLGALRGKVAKD